MISSAHRCAQPGFALKGNFDGHGRQVAAGTGASQRNFMHDFLHVKRLNANWMGNSRGVILSAILFALGMVPCKAATSKPDSHYYKNIHSSNSSLNGFSRLPLEGEVYAKTRLDLGDVRILGGQGQEIPFALYEDRETTTDEEFRPRIYNQAQLPGQYSTLSLDLGRTLLTNKMLLYRRA